MGGLCRGEDRRCAEVWMDVHKDEDGGCLWGEDGRCSASTFRIHLYPITGLPVTVI